jgi:hypothetical protein
MVKEQVLLMMVKFGSSITTADDTFVIFVLIRVNNTILFAKIFPVKSCATTHISFNPGTDKYETGV